MSQRIKLSVNCGFGFKPGNDWIIVEEISSGVFKAIDNSFTSEHELAFCSSCVPGCCWWDEEVEDLDDGYSDEAQRFGWSCHLRWNDVEVILDSQIELRAPSVDRLQEALRHLVFSASCPAEL